MSKKIYLKDIPVDQLKGITIKGSRKWTIRSVSQADYLIGRFNSKIEGLERVRFLIDIIDERGSSTLAPLCFYKDHEVVSNFWNKDLV